MQRATAGRLNHLPQLLPIASEQAENRHNHSPCGFTQSLGPRSLPVFRPSLSLIGCVIAAITVNGTPPVSGESTLSQHSRNCSPLSFVLHIAACFAMRRGLRHPQQRLIVRRVDQSMSTSCRSSGGLITNASVSSAVPTPSGKTFPALPYHIPSKTFASLIPSLGPIGLDRPFASGTARNSPLPAVLSLESSAPSPETRRRALRRDTQSPPASFPSSDRHTP